MFMYTQTTFRLRKGPLPAKSPVKHHRWSDAEDKALVEFIGLANTDTSYGHDFQLSQTDWQSFRERHIFWTDAAKHVQTATASNFLLTSR